MNLTSILDADIGLRFVAPAIAGCGRVVASGGPPSTRRQGILRLAGQKPETQRPVSRLGASVSMAALAIVGSVCFSAWAEGPDGGQGKTLWQWQADEYRTLTHDVATETAYLNLKSGNFIKPADWRIEAVRKEFSKLGIDLFHSPVQSNGEQCLCRDMDVVAVKDGWTLAAKDVAKVLADARRQGKSNRNVAPIGTFLDPRVTYVFETRDGSRGVLELLPDAKNAGVKTVRYKLVELVTVSGVKLPDGVYLASRTQNDKEGVRVMRSDSGNTVVLDKRLAGNFGDASMGSIANDNTRFRINLKSAGPFPGGADQGQLALVIDNVCVMVWGHSELDATGHMDLSAGVANRADADKIAARLKVTPRLRSHPGYKIEAAFSPTAESFTPGQPVVLEMQIKNIGDKPFTFYDGGRQRGARDNQFNFTARGAAGKGAELPVIDVIDFGGISFLRTLKPGDVLTKQVDVTKWFDLKRPDTYRIAGRFEMEINTSDDGSYRIDWDETARGECLVVIVDPDAKE